MTLLLRKLQRMGLGEISFRAKTAYEQRVEEWSFALGFGRNPDPGLTPEEAEALVFPYPWFDTRKVEATAGRLHATFPAYVKEMTQAAESVCARRFSFFEATFQFGATIPWLADPVSGREWPKTFHADVNIFGGDVGTGDVKYVWELNRHQFIPTLGKAYALTKDERYAEEAFYLIIDWIHANPFKVGINWASALEVAVRSLAWCWALAFFQTSPGFSSERRLLILKSLYQHGLFLETHLSFFFSPYNHLIGEASALFVLGTLLPGLKAADRWKATGWRILEQEISKQFHHDGGTVEQATGYHHFTLGFYLQAILLRRQQSLAIPSEIWSMFEKVFEYAMYMMRPDGTLPMIGDGDEGKALSLWQPSLWDFRPFLSIGAVLFGRGDFKKMADGCSPDTLWLIGNDGWDRYHELPEEIPGCQSKALSSSGYYIMRTGWGQDAHYLNFDCGELADGVHVDDIPSAAHGHADALSIEVSVAGVPLLVDPGFYTYNGAIEWHRYFRETASHSTVVIDGQSQAEYRNRLTWSHGPSVKTHHWMSSPVFDYVEGSHDGYTRLPQPVIHRRSVLFLKPDFWLIRDELTGEGEHQIDRYFHFSPGEIVCNQEGMSAQTQSFGRGNISIVACEKTGTVEVLEKGERPEAGWIAPGYGLKIQAPVVRYRMRGTVPVVLHTLVIPLPHHFADLVIDTFPIDHSPSSSLCRVLSIMTTQGSDVVLFSSTEGMKSFFSDWKTDGAVVCVRRDEKGVLKSALLIEGSTLVIDESVVFKVAKKVHFVSLSFEDGVPNIEISEAVDVSTAFSNVRILISPQMDGIRNP